MTVASAAPAVQFKVASEDWEFDEIHRLNYETFVEEIPQHEARPDRRLVDRFHDRNTYFIAVRDRNVLGMLAFRGERPFSLDRKLPDLDRHLPTGRRICEVRLLATTKNHRNGLIFRGLVDGLTEHAVKNGFDTAVISGTVRQLRLYQHMGFVAFGPVVGSGDALYQPMYLTLETFAEQSRTFPALRSVRRRDNPLNFLPGPINVHPEVREAFARLAVSHRSVAFVRDFQEVRNRLCNLTRALNVQVMMGSGTLANDIVGAQISTWRTPGLVLSNGAFGERLVDHARRLGLMFHMHQMPWGKSFDRRTIETILELEPSLRWLWAVHGETSTGMLNDFTLLKEIASAHDLRLCIDAVSSLGNVPVDLSGVALASGVSGKGLGAYSGLALVFHAVRPSVHASLPRFLDLASYAGQDGVPFTVSSNLLVALKAALERFEGEAHFDCISRTAVRLRAGLHERGFSVVADHHPFPAVTTIALPIGIDSVDVGRRLEDAGYLVNYRSSHLPKRNWIQVCLMGAFDPRSTDELLDVLQRFVD